jgi:sigma-B regulation protein RsbU (phosphoserine phosphatase)
MADATSRASRFLSWLTGTRLGRTALAGLVVKAIVQFLRPLVGSSSAVEGLDVLASVVLVAVAVIMLVRWLGHVRRILLWRVRRKLLLSYFLIGVVPAFLLVLFFALAVMLLFFNIGSYMLRTQITTLAERTHTEAQTAALQLRASASPADAAQVLADRRQAASGTLAGLSLAVLDAPGRCGPAAPGSGVAGTTVGAWAPHGAPASLPPWVPCAGQMGLVDLRGAAAGAGTGVAVRGVAWVPGMSRAVVAEVPLDQNLAAQIAQATGVSVLSIARVPDDGASPPVRQQALDPAQPARQDDALERRIPLGPAQIPREGQRGGGLTPSLQWASFLDATEWAGGRPSLLFVEFGLDLVGVYRLVTATPTPAFADVSFAQVLLIGLAVVAGLFFLIQLVAYVMGFALARSITGAVHELFEGTEQVRKGDFSHKIHVPSQDQLGELAASFNTMTTSIEDLLRQKAQKERLEQELEIARGIQMSLLPQAPLEAAGVSFAGHCEPARAVGGDYYDFWPIDEHRYGMLIADVAGKGTSAALYMAELKGIVLSLSQSHSSPRRLLIDANRIISRHLDSRSFITMTYGVVDVQAGTLTYARAGHCPLIHLPGPHAASREPAILTPDGMVLGMDIDDGRLFARLLEESTVPLGEGDVFVLYTDGVTEAMSPDGEFFGEGRLSALAQQYAGGSFAELRKEVLSAVNAFAAPSEQQDDITMLVVQVQHLPVAA